MPAADISRLASEPEKRYEGVRLQQGRVSIDDDFNEHAQLEAERARAALLDVVGAVGSPNDGFRVTNLVAQGESFDFDILAGSFYLGGLRLEAFQDGKFAAQDDWLTMPESERARPVSPGIQLAYLEVWQQPVTATEDDELFEKGLGGPDTSTRVRTMRRVRVASVTADECALAWQELIDRWRVAGGPGLVSASGEIVPDSRLTVTYDDTGPSTDLCSPHVQGGYLGGENQAIRVQLVDAGHLTWGLDNAAPLYRVEVLGPTTLRLLGDPVDQAHWPVAGQVVEVLQAGAQLSNGERLAEPTGHLARLAGSYDPETRTLELAAGEALSGPPFLGFLRVWNRGDDRSSAARLAFTPGTPVALGHTGLRVTIDGPHAGPGDHWIIAARPETPRKVVPWSLESGRRPHGVRRFVAPLALIDWRIDGELVVGEVRHDCRPHFQPLTQRDSCCTHTVGNGVTGRGRFTSIQAAVDALPRQGGKVCLLAGDYREAFEIIGRRNVTIEGCGTRTRLFAPEGGPSQQVVLIEASQQITLRQLTIVAEAKVGVLIRAARPQDDGPINPDEPVFRVPTLFRLATQQILLEKLDIIVRDRAGVIGENVRFLTLRGNHIVAGTLGASLDDGEAGRWPAVYLHADDVLVEDNLIEATVELIAPRLEVMVAFPTFTRTAMGGLTIGGGSERVEIRRNRIRGGNGCGITLGSWAWVPASQMELRVKDHAAFLRRLIIAWPGIGFRINEEGCIEVEWNPRPPGGGGGDDPLVPVSMGGLSDLRIVDNTIERMGRSGIGVARYFDAPQRFEIISVERLIIEGNRIRECVRLPIPEILGTMGDLAGSGAIALGDCEDLVVRDNFIEGNGRRHVDPVCGVFALRVSGGIVERNRIVDNAPFVRTSDPVRPGLRGGIVVLHATMPMRLVEEVEGEPRLRPSGLPALVIHDNVVVVPEGRTILLGASGSIVISDNRLTSRGPGRADWSTQLAGATRNNAVNNAVGTRPLFSQLFDLVGGCTVLVISVARSALFAPSQPINYRSYRNAELLYAALPLTSGLGEGAVSFHDNTATLDLRGAPTNLVLSSVALLSYDDVSVMSNELSCLQDRDIVVADLVAFGFSTRVSDNRLSEAFDVGGLSAVTYAIVNTTTDNQATHCMLVAGALKVNRDNLILQQAGNPDACGGVGTLVGTINDKYLGRIDR